MIILSSVNYGSDNYLQPKRVAQQRLIRVTQPATLNTLLKQAIKMTCYKVNTKTIQTFT